MYTTTFPAMRNVFLPHWKHEEAWNKNSDQFYQFLAYSLIIIHTAFLGWWLHCVLWSMFMNISEESVAFPFRLSLTVPKKHNDVTICQQHTKHNFRNKYFGNLPKIMQPWDMHCIIAVLYLLLRWPRVAVSQW